VSKTDFPRLLERTFQRAKPGNNLLAAFEKCGLSPVNVNRAVERVPHREMDAPDTIRGIFVKNLWFQGLGLTLDFWGRIEHFLLMNTKNPG
jgi:hypothetical protein